MPIPSDLVLVWAAAGGLGLLRDRVPRWAVVLAGGWAAACTMFGMALYGHMTRIVFNRHPPLSPAALWRFLGWIRPVEALFRLLTAPFRCTPDLLILGEVRCGTTSVAEHLSRFPGATGPFCPWKVPFADNKESFYFVGHYLGLVHPVFFRMCFPLQLERSLARLRGKPFFCYDACAQYLTAPWVPRLAAKACPDAQLIVCLREPVGQNVSWWRFEHGSHEFADSMGLGSDWITSRAPPATMREALEIGSAPQAQELWSRAERLPNSWFMPSWALTWPGGQLRALPHLGDFAGNIRRWQKHFDPERFCYIELKDLSPDNLSKTLHRMTEMVPDACCPEQDDLDEPKPVHANSSQPSGPPPSEDDLRFARQMYAGACAEVEEVTGRTFPHWRNT
eukprot:Hpha_TRINITY_DN5089_c0_g1::TRINITY_DN5089_c0_g1_i1::g.94106::m.94106